MVELYVGRTIKLEINQAIKSIQHNFLLSTEEKLGLMGLFQELQENRKNPLLKMQPCWKYVRENTIDQQLDHIIQEIEEVRKEFNMGKKSLEGWDCHQATYTLMYIFEKYGVDLKETVNTGIRKNTDREGGSYYE